MTSTNMRLSISARWKGVKDKLKGNSPDSNIPAIAGSAKTSGNNVTPERLKLETAEPRVGVVANLVNGVNNVASKSGSAKKEQKEEKKRLKQILKAHNGSIVGALQDATTQGIVTDVRLILSSPMIQRLDVPAWEIVLRSAPTNNDAEILKLLLDKLPVASPFSNDFLCYLLEIIVNHQLWTHAVSISKRFSNDMRLRRVRYDLQNGRESELRFLLQEFPADIELLDPGTELIRVPEEMSRSAFLALLLLRHSNNLSAALADACKRNSMGDVGLLITHPSMNTKSSENWIHAIEVAASSERQDILSLLLDRAPADGFVRECMLREIRHSVGAALHNVAGIIFTKYLVKYSVLGVWNDMQWNDEWLLQFYLGVRPSYASDVAAKTGQSLLHFLLSWWPKVTVLKVAIDAGDVDIEAPFEKAHRETIRIGVTARDQTNIGTPGDTPLIRATRMGLTEILELLLNRGADIHAKDTTGRTALHIAAEDGHVSMVQLLLEKCANSSTLNPDGEAAADLAAKKGRHRVLKMLRKHAGLPPTSSSELESEPSSRHTTSYSPKASSSSAGYYYSSAYPDIVVTDSRRMEKYTLTASDPAYWN